MAFKICLACEPGRINFSFRRSHPCDPGVAPKLVSLVLSSEVYVGLTLREVIKRTKEGIWVLVLFASYLQRHYLGLFLLFLVGVPCNG
jgi:hypothetical protein